MDEGYFEEDETRRICDRFETGLLCKEDNAGFSDSYPIAVKRLTYQVEKRLRMNPVLYAKVRSMIADYLVKDYAREVTASKLLALDCRRVLNVPLNFVHKP